MNPGAPNWGGGLGGLQPPLNFGEGGLTPPPDFAKQTLTLLTLDFFWSLSIEILKSRLFLIALRKNAKKWTFLKIDLGS